MNRSSIAFLLASGCAALCLVAGPASSQVPSRALRGSPQRTVRFAVLGDYGDDTVQEGDVARTIRSWQPEFVITVGDNNYPLGEAATIDSHIGQYYHDFIYPYIGAYGAGATLQRFFPSLGNHDWYTVGAQPYLDYFQLPGNERYYDFVRGPVHLFAIDSDPNEPDGQTSTSVQAQWLQARLAASTAPFKIVYFHHPPYSSSQHGPEIAMQWPFKAWGASVVLSGHDHAYERFRVGGLTHFVDGLGGHSLYSFGTPLPGSELHYNADYGAMLVEATDVFARFQFVTRTGTVVDECTLGPGGFTGDRTPLVTRGDSWKYLDTGVDQGTAWRQGAFDDSTWSTGPAQLGYGEGDEATVVSFGPNASAKYITTYFRKSFTVSDPTLLEGLELELLRDDGVLVWLNGSELVRSNLPAGAVLFSTRASIGINGDDELRYYYFEYPTSLLVAGTNTLAVEMHQIAPSNNDLSFDLSLSGVNKGTPLVPTGAVWSYRDNGVDPGPTWTSPSFDDSAWSSGPAELGYGDGGEATTIGYGLDPAHKFPTTWFRHEFTLVDPSTIRALSLRLKRDDGAVVFLNGVEATRSNVRFGPVSANELAQIDVVGADESAFVETSLDPRLLRAGNNVIAVEVHQGDPASSDVSFDLALTAY